MAKPIAEIITTETRGLLTTPTITRTLEPTPRIIAAVQPFKTFGERDLIAAKDAAVAYMSHLRGLERVRNPRGHWLTYLGRSGTGKTWLAQRIFDYWQTSLATYSDAATGAMLDRRGAKITMPKLMTLLKGGDRNISRTVQDLTSAPFLFLDEIGADRDASGFAAEILHKIISERVGYPTVLTSNSTMAELAKIDGRIASRVIRDENVKVEINAVDYAMRKQ